MKRSATLVGVAVGVGLLAACGPSVELPEPEVLAVRLDSIASTAPDEYADGKRSYEMWCAVCHGPAAGGSTTGPPLVHPVYRPAHHADAAFYIGIRNGVVQHHFRFGPMPALPGVSDEEAREVVAYVRWLQRSMGIE